MSSPVSEAIDARCRADQEGPRPHLGASRIGTPCARELVYSFRHAVTIRHEGRMCRLFRRGHEEEPKIYAHLRGIGMEVQEFAQRLSYHPATGSYAAEEWDAPMWPGCEDVTGIPAHVWVAEHCAGVRLRQWHFSDFGGHFSGSTDGRGRLPSTAVRALVLQLPLDEWGLLECKTHNDKSFKRLVACGQDPLQLASFKPLHYDQMQTYMGRKGLSFALYIGVNKNDDDLHTIVVPAVAEVAAAATERARQTVCAARLPPRKFGSASHVGCKFCDYREPCWFGRPLEKKCRTCAHVVAVEDARFFCGRWSSLIPRATETEGCGDWVAVTD